MIVNGYEIKPGVNLSYVNLSNADLSNARLCGARLCYANLSNASLRNANLSNADLRNANLSCASLSCADLSNARLCGANLRRAGLIKAQLRNASLYQANLSRANLDGTNLWFAGLAGAFLEGTCLDPANSPNGRAEDFDPYEKGLVIGYRSRKTPHIGEYLDGRTYRADWFSTADTPCHPGLYLCPSIPHVREFVSPSLKEIIAVVTHPKDIHRAGRKWRCRWFRVLGDAYSL